MAKSGDRTERISIYRNVGTGSENTLGEEITTTELVASVWAQVVEGSSSEQTAQNQQQAIGTHTITIVWLDGITEEMHIVWRERTLNISGIQSDRKNLEVIITAQEKRG